ncbi:MAG: thioredoxin domain-containing protein [Planctomycetota bacterium]
MASRSPTRPSATSASPAARSMAPGVVVARKSFVLGLVAVVFSADMSLLLAIEHLSGLNLPGCGPGSACQRAAEGPWGALPLGAFAWPVAYLGLAYFLAALVAWAVARGALPTLFRYVVRLGALVSLFYCALIAWEWLLCPYCIAAHVGNFVFWFTMERAGAAAPRRAPVLTAFAATFIVVTIGLAVGDWQMQSHIRSKGERERSESVQKIVDRGTATQPARAVTAPATAPAGTPAGPTADRPPPVTTTTSAPPPAEKPFTGRYRRGPERAPIRIVMFTDFQCRDCRRIEQEVQQILSQRSDVSLSIKHFPFNDECNPYVSGKDHPNACWAARAAEAAGLLWGSEGFWKMHDWLFEVQGVFSTSQEVEQAIRGFGYNPAGFFDVMQSPETLARVQTDVQEGNELGLFFTPMIFINGVELKGWYAKDALPRTVAELAARNLPPGTPEDDRPPAALEKYVADWRDERVHKLPPDEHPWWLGPPEARVRIVVWGDYQEPLTTEADGIIRAFAAGRNDVTYSFRHYPFNTDCNPHVSTKRFPHACRAAQAAEAAGQLGGPTAHAAMHAWLMDNAPQFSEDAVVAAAVEMGLDAAAFRAALDAPGVAARIAEDVRAAKMLPSLRYGAPPGLHAIPAIFINGKYVPRWRPDRRQVLDVILRAAAEP